MPASTLRKAAIAWCVLMAVGTAAAMAADAPFVLTALFTAVWLFGAAMLWQFPRFGAAGTALYGVILGVEILRMHGFTGSTLAISIGSFVGTGLAIMVFLELRRG